MSITDQNGKGMHIYDFCMLKGGCIVAHMVDNYQHNTTHSNNNYIDILKSINKISPFSDIDGDHIA